MTQLALNRRATEVGVTDQELEHAEDTADYKGAVIELVFAKDARGSPMPGGDGQQKAALRAELRGMRQLALNKRAAAAGVTDQQLEGAEAAEDYKGAVIALIVHAEASTGSQGDAAVQREDPQAALRELVKSSLTLREKRAHVKAAEPNLSFIDCTARVIELEGLRLGSLTKRAMSEGLGEEELDEAMEGGDQRAAGTLTPNYSPCQGGPTPERADLRCRLQQMTAIAEERERARLAMESELEAALKEIGEQHRSSSSQGSAEAREGGLRNELEGFLEGEDSPLRLGALSKRALREGVGPGAINEAMQSNNQRGALIQLIVDCEAASAQLAEEAPGSALRSELSAMRLRESRSRAKVRKLTSWPRSWANFSLLQLYSHRNAWANLHLLGQPDTAPVPRPRTWTPSCSRPRCSLQGSKTRLRRLDRSCRDCGARSPRMRDPQGSCWMSGTGYNEHTSTASSCWSRQSWCAHYNPYRSSAPGLPLWMPRPPPAPPRRPAPGWRTPRPEEPHRSGNIRFSPRSTAQPIYTRFPTIFGGRFF
jgi:hypothetical protein